MKTINSEELERRINKRQSCINRIDDPVLKEIGELLIKDMKTLISDDEVSVEDGFSTGVVQWYDEKKGFGFIKPDGMQKDIFVHASTLDEAGMRYLEDGQRVKFRIRRNGRSGKMQAEDLRRV